MKKISLIYTGAALVMLSSCIQEFDPQSGTVIEDQAATAPGSYENFVSAITSNISGKFVFSDRHQANDFGYTSLYLMRGVMGNDMVPIGGDNQWFGTWYECGIGLAPIYLNCQYPWTFYYTQINNCNQVLRLAGDNPSESQIAGVGIAHTMRAYFYLEMSQMFAQKPYGVDSQSPTVPIIKDKIDLSAATENPRAPFSEMMQFIMGDLDAAETELDGYSRPNKYTPDKSVVYGLKARAYLLMEDWANAEKYAKLAQEGYQMLTADEYTSRVNGFNNADSNNSWMLACGFKDNDICVTYNDGDNSWGTWMICEFPAGGDTDLGYYNNYGAAIYMDRHLYETMPTTDIRRKCFVDFALDEMSSKEEIVEALKEYSDVPEYVFATGQIQGAYGGMPLKFRSKDGNHTTNQVGYCVDVPMMRVEEMILIEAEAAGMQSEGRGIQLLTDFATKRDPNYVYGKHNEAYGNSSTSAFVNECWWQRRVEFWGEGIATLDIKRLQKGIIRNYPNTNHISGYRWNTTTPPDWMNYCIVQTETNYNGAVVNNPTPIPPTGDSPEHIW